MRNSTKSEKYKKLQSEFMRLKRINAENYMKNKVESLKRSNPSEFFRRLKETGARQGEEKEASLKIHTH